MNKLRILLVTLLLLSAYSTEAQSASISNIQNLQNIKQKGPIFENEKLVGYYVVYFKEKKDKKTNTHIVEIFDDNYNSVNSIEITRPRNNHLMETVYNGEVFMLFFYDVSYGYVYLTYNKNGDEIGSYKLPKKDIPSFDLRNTILSNSDSHHPLITVYPMGKSGFIRQNYTKNNKIGYGIVAFDNALNVIWTLESDTKSKLIQLVEITDISEKIIAATIMKKKSFFTMKGDREFILLDATTGELIKNVDMGNREGGQKTVLKTFFDEKEEKIILIGEFFNFGDNVLKDKSQGIFIKELSEEGENISITEYEWKGKIDQFKNDDLKKEKKKDAKASVFIFFHKVIRSENGHLILIGEHFGKEILTGEGHNDTSVEITVSDMIVIELDEENELINYKTIKKKRSNVYLPQGHIGYNSGMLGYYINKEGGFDYGFTSTSVTDKNEFTVFYKDYERKDGISANSSDVIIGVLHIKDGNVDVQRIPKTIEAKRFWIMPAKLGSISIMEYFRKENKFDMRLEKLEY